MDLALTETQEMLRVAARDFLERECPTTLVRAMEGDEPTVSGVRGIVELRLQPIYLR